MSFWLYHHHHHHQPPCFIYSQERDRSLSRLKDLLDLAQANLNVKEEELKQAAQEVGYLKDSLERQRARHADEMRQLQEGGRAELRRLKGDLAEYKTHLALYRESAQGSPAATIEQVLVFSTGI